MSGGAPGAAGRWTRLALAALVVAAVLLRIYGLTWGLPDAQRGYSYAADEDRAVGLALGMDLGAGELEPRWHQAPFFKWGTVYPYSVHVVLWVARAAGWLRFGDAGPPPGPEDTARAFLAARGVSVAWSLAAVALAVLLARRWYGGRAAGWTLASCALLPLAVSEAHLATVSSCAAFWCLAALLGLDHALARGTPRACGAAGAAVGLALATKLSALLLLAPAGLVAALAATRAARPATAFLRCGLALAAGTAAGFALGSPFVFVYPEQFLAHAHRELFVHSARGHGHLFDDSGPGLRYLLLVTLPVALGWSLWAASLAGVGRTLAGLARGLRAGAWRCPAPAWRGDLLAGTWIALHVVALSTAQTRFLRYLLPVAPVLALGAGRLFAELESRARTRGAGAARALTGALGLLVLAPCAALSLAQVLPLGREDPRDAAARWFRANVPPGALVGLPRRPGNLTPPVHPWARAGGWGEPDPASPWRWTVLEADAARLAAEAPDYVVHVPRALEPARRAGVPEVVAFLARLEADYEDAAGPWSNPKTLFGLRVGAEPGPPGWSPASPTVRVLRRRAR